MPHKHPIIIKGHPISVYDNTVVFRLLLLFPCEWPEESFLALKESLYSPVLPMSSPCQGAPDFHAIYGHSSKYSLLLLGIHIPLEASFCHPAH